MKTQLGNTTKSFGKEYNISVSNLGGEGVLSTYSYLRENTIIIDSKVDSNFEDIGSYSIFMTDSNGNPVRLTYTIQPGNGLYPDPTDTDILRMVIDDSSIMANDGDEIYVNKHNIIDNDTLTVDPTDDGNSKRGRIHVVTQNLEKASDARYGVVTSDQNTTYIPYEYYKNINSDPDAEPEYQKIELNNPGDIPQDYDLLVESGKIMVNTQNLDTVDDSSNRDGIVKHNSETFRTIEAVDGKLTVLTYNLDKASYTDYGVIKTDGITIQADDSGVVSVLTDGLEHSNKSKFGISKGDEVTINSLDGVLSVNTRNLSYATYTAPGVVIIDKYSMSVNEGKIEVNRYNEIESILDRNNPEHDLFRSDIEDLKNRVSKLETAALQEVIEFLIPVGDPETSLPQPIFDRDTWTVNHYSDRKTISFSIKTNCKFNVNVEYKNGTNDYSQVELINVRYGDEDTIPANQLANTIFNATGNTVKTLYFTFVVRNYDKDDNLASINTQAIISAASINDSSIKQTQFHIFKCWNNIAFTEDKPVKPEIPEPIIIPESYLLTHVGTEKIYAYNYAYNFKEVVLSYNKTTSNNFFFTTTIDATYCYCTYTDGQYVWGYKTDVPTYQCPKIGGNSSYDINIKYQNIDEDGGVVGGQVDSLDWLNTYITASYNTTRAFNVLTVFSKKPLTEKSRAAYITCYLNTVDLNNSTESNIKLNTKFGEIKKFNNATLSHVNYTYTSEQDLSQKSTNIESFKNTVLNTLSQNITDDSLLSLKRTNINNAKNNVTNLNTSNTSYSSVFSKIIENDITEFNNVKAELDNYYTNNLNSKTPETYQKEKYIAYYTYVKKLDKYAYKLADEYNKFVDILSNEKNKFDNKFIINNNEVLIKNNPNNYNSYTYLTLFYSEKMDLVQPIINVTSSINAKDNGIKFSVIRNEKSLLKINNYPLLIQYNYINKSGNLVNSDGTSLNPSNRYEKYLLNIPKESTTYTNVLLNNVINGTNTETTTETIYYNVINIYGDKYDLASFIGIGRSDGGTVYYGGWWPNVDGEGGTNGKLIEDNIYAVYKLTGQEASFGLFSQKYSFWTINLKGKSSGYSQDLCQANEIEFVGLSKTPYSKSRNASYYNKVTIGKNVYMVNRTTNNTTSLKTISKNYYDNNKTSLKYTTNNKTIKVSNNITGIKIKNAVIPNWDDVFYLQPKITYTSTGSWESKDGDKSFNDNKKCTFGNAKIVSINISRWDDFTMNISFNVVAGDTTHLPNNTQIIEYVGSSFGRSNIIFLQGSKSYEYSQFYNSLSVSCTNWVNNTCTVTFKLSNPYSLNNTPGLEVKEYFYSLTSDTLKPVYVDREIPFSGKNNRNYIKASAPLLANITGIKFWVGLNTTSTCVVEKQYISSLSSIGTEVLISGNYKTGCAKSLSIVNANTTQNTNISNKNFGNKEKNLSNTLLPAEK